MTDLMESLLAPVGAALWLVTLAFLIRKAVLLPRLPRSPEEPSEGKGDSAHPLPAASAKGAEHEVGEAVDASAGNRPSFTHWIGLLWCLLAVMVASGLMLALPPAVSRGGASVHVAVEAVLGICALLLYIPYLPVSKVCSGASYHRQ